MGLLGSIFRRRHRTNIPPEHAGAVDPLYAEINVEEIGVYQRYFDRILAHVDVANYTQWSMSRTYDRTKLNTDDEWMCQVLQEAQRDGISGALLQNMVSQYFFADILEREQEKSHWIRRVMHRKPTDFFPDAARLRVVMEMFSS